MLALVLSLGLVSCGENAVDEEAVPEWETLADGSRLLVTAYSEVEREDIERCFPSSSELECLRAVRLNPGGIHLSRYNRSELSEEQASQYTSRDMTGYRCVIYQDGAAGDFIRESIWSERGELRTNTVQVPRSFNQKALSKNEVEAYFTANSIKPRDPWLNCHRVAQLVVSGSFASLTSSDLTLEIFASD